MSSSGTFRCPADQELIGSHVSLYWDRALFSRTDPNGWVLCHKPEDYDTFCKLFDEWLRGDWNVSFVSTSQGIEV
jgi:hypothetical protein